MQSSPLPCAGAYTARSLASFICQVGLLSMDMMDYFDPIFNAYKNRNRRAGENNFQDMEWAHQRVRPGELGFDPRRYDSTTRYDWIRKWAHLHVKVKVVGVFDTVGSLGMSGWVHQPGQDVDWHATKLHPSKWRNQRQKAQADAKQRSNMLSTRWRLTSLVAISRRQCSSAIKPAKMPVSSSGNAGSQAIMATLAARAKPDMT